MRFELLHQLWVLVLFFGIAQVAFSQDPPADPCDVTNLKFKWSYSQDDCTSSFCYLLDDVPPLATYLELLGVGFKNRSEIIPDPRVPWRTPTDGAAIMDLPRLANPTTEWFCLKLSAVYNHQFVQATLLKGSYACYKESRGPSTQLLSCYKNETTSTVSNPKPMQTDDATSPQSPIEPKYFGRRDEFTSISPDIGAPPTANWVLTC